MLWTLFGFYQRRGFTHNLVFVILCHRFWRGRNQCVDRLPCGLFWMNVFLCDGFSTGH